MELVRAHLFRMKLKRSLLRGEAIMWRRRLHCRSWLRLLGRPFSFRHSCPPFSICGHAKSRPETHLFPRTNGNQAELDRAGISAHRSKACQNSRVMTSLQCCGAPKRNLTNCRRAFADGLQTQTLSLLYKMDCARRNEFGAADHSSEAHRANQSVNGGHGPAADSARRFGAKLEKPSRYGLFAASHCNAG